MDTEAVYQSPSEEEVKTLLTEKFPEVEVTKTEARRVSTVIGVDYVDHMTVVYHLSNYYNGLMIELSTDLPADDLHVESVTCVWEGANWHERETYELFGIIFDNHPKLERLLTPKTYEFYPFRKSYKLRGSE